MRGPDDERARGLVVPATRRAFVGALAAGGAGLAAVGSSSALAASPRFDDPSKPKFDVTKAPYGATGNGTTNDTTAVQAAIDAAAGAGGGVVFFPKGTYLVSTLDLRDKVALAGEEMTVSVIKAAGGAEALLDGRWEANVTVLDLTLDGASRSGLRVGLNCHSNDSGRRVRVERCRFLSFTASDASSYPLYGTGIDAWPAPAVLIYGCEFLDCRRPIVLHDPGDEVVVSGNRIVSPGNLTVNGITCRSGASRRAPVVIAGNVVSDARVDASGNGIDGHGIQLHNVQGVRVEGNVVRNFLTSGIHPGSGAYDASVVGNTCFDGTGTGIYVELYVDQDVTVGTNGSPRGATVAANTCFRNGWGIGISWAAASIVDGNICHDNRENGIFCDSDRCVISSNVAYNNSQSGQPPEGGIVRKKAGIRNYGKRCTHVGNVCFDNQPTKTQEHGIAVSLDKHIVNANQLAGNGGAGLFEGEGGGTANVTAANVTT